MIKVMVADDHQVVRAGLATLLSAAVDIELVAVAEDGATAVALAGETHPDVVLMDLSMPVLDGVAATRRIMAADPDVKVVVLTSFGERERILDAIDAGALGYLLKDVDGGDLLSAVRAASRGESPLDPRAAKELLAARSARRPAVELTERERDVLALVGEGLLNKQIARRLGISEKTVKSHLTSIFQRLGVTDRTQAALWAQRQRLNRQS